MSRKIVSFDWAIKYILRDKSNFVILEGFLLALLREDIKIVDILESESNKENEYLKFNRVDLIAKNHKEELIIIEVQFSPEDDYLKRLLFGVSRNIVDNIHSGENYSKVKKIYVISLIYFDFFNTRTDGSIIKDYVTHGKTVFKGIHSIDSIDLDNHLFVGYHKYKREEENIFPEIYIISMSIFNDDVKDNLDQWLYAFKNHEVKEEFEAPGIKTMSERLNFLSMNPEQQLSYNKFLENNASIKGAIKFAESAGIEQGIEQERQRSEHEKKSIVINLFKEGSEPAFISKITGLTIEEIKAIINPD